MSLRRKFLLHNLLLVGGLVLIGAVSVWRLSNLRNEVGLSRSVYAELHTIENVALETGTVRGLLQSPQANREQLVTHLTFAMGGLDQFIQVGQGYGGDGDTTLKTAYVPINAAAASARQKLGDVLDQFQTGGATIDSQAAQRDLDGAIADLDRVSSSCIGFMNEHQQSASTALEKNLLLIGLLLSGAALAAVLLSIAQHRLVMMPLQRLRTGVRRLAGAEFAQPMDAASMAAAPEFRELAEEFNRMAGELDGFYRRLEEQVRIKSRELVRSERLASVGYLAAGVAHEINNPLNIISGHAELTARQIAKRRVLLQDPATDEAAESLRIIRDEAFRCKQITDKLLSLARKGSDTREALDLGGIARDVAAMTRGLTDYRDRRLTLKLDPQEPLEVEANASEMKQVLLNLTINALDSVPPIDGEVCIEGRRTAKWVELSIQDNGKGMAADVLPHVFEPFFTARRGSGNRGTGLGLSITHAIVESHGGTISAQSEGPGRGARFTIQLPARNGSPNPAAVHAKH
jgi:signal transduction histidine kinase